MTASAHTTMQDNIALIWLQAPLEEELHAIRSTLEQVSGESSDQGGDRTEAAVQAGQAAARCTQLGRTLDLLLNAGGASLAQEMAATFERLGHAFTNGQQTLSTALLNSLIQADYQLQHYLERSRAGRADMPLLLLPALNDLRAARGERLLSEYMVGSLDLKLTPATLPLAIDEAARGAVRNARLGFDRSLLFWLQRDDLAALAQLGDLLPGLELALAGQPAWALPWRLAAATVESLLASSTPPGNAVKSLFGRLSQLLGQIGSGKEGDASLKMVEEITHGLLYYLPRILDGAQPGVLTTALMREFNLSAVTAEHLDQSRAAEQESLNAPDLQVLQTVAQNAREELTQITEGLDLFARGAAQDVPQLQSYAGQLRRLGDTLIMLGMPDARQRAMSGADQLEQLLLVLQSGQGASEAALLDLAAELLAIDTLLERITRPRYGQGEIGHQPPLFADPALAESRRAITEQLFEGFLKIKDALQRAFEGESPDRTLLARVPDWLGELRGVLQLAQLSAVMPLLDGLEHMVKARQDEDETMAEALEPLAEVSASVEYYLENAHLFGHSAPELLSVGFAALGLPLDALQQTADTAELAEGLKTTAVEATAAIPPELPLAGFETLTLSEGPEPLPELVPEALPLPAPQLGLETTSAMPAAAAVEQAPEWTLDASTEPPADDATGFPSFAFPPVVEAAPGVEQGVEQGVDFGFAPEPAPTADYAPATDHAAAQWPTPPDSLTLPGAPDAALNPHPVATAAEPSGLAAPAVATEWLTLQPTPAATAVEPEPLLPDDADPEIAEIFVEEFADVMEELRDARQRFSTAAGDPKSVVELRRGYHTLKGSGRTIGAKRIGEYAWAWEQVMNRLLEGQIQRSDALIEQLRRSEDLLGQMLLGLKGETSDLSTEADLLLAAEALREGKTEWATAPAAVVAIAAPAAAAVTAAWGEAAITTASPTTHVETASVETTDLGTADVERVDIGIEYGATAAPVPAEPTPVIDFSIEPAAIESSAEFGADIGAELSIAPGDSFNTLSPDAAVQWDAPADTDLTDTSLSLEPEPTPPEYQPEHPSEYQIEAESAASPQFEFGDLSFSDGAERAAIDLPPAPQAPVAPEPESTEFAAWQPDPGVSPAPGFAPLEEAAPPIIGFPALDADLDTAPAPLLAELGLDRPVDAAAAFPDLAPEPQPAEDETGAATHFETEPATATAGWPPAEMETPPMVASSDADATSRPEAELSFLDEVEAVMDEPTPASRAPEAPVEAPETRWNLDQLSLEPARPTEEAVPEEGPESAETLLRPHTEAGTADAAPPVLPEVQSAETAPAQATAEPQPGPIEPAAPSEEVGGGASPFSEPSADSGGGLPPGGETSTAEADADTADVAPAGLLPAATGQPDCAAGEGLTTELPETIPTTGLEPDPLEVDPASIEEKLLGIFLGEGEDLLRASETTLSEWLLDTADASPLLELKRHLHTLKGSARMAGVEPLGLLTHAIETLVEAIRQGHAALSAESFALLQQGFDGVDAALLTLSQGEHWRLDESLLEALHNPPVPSAEVPTIPTPSLPPDVPNQADPDLLEIFGDESRELLDEIEAQFGAWQQRPVPRDLVALKRPLHTFKGGARMAGMRHIGEVAHQMETLLEGVEVGRVEAGPLLGQLMREALDALEQGRDHMMRMQPIEEPTLLLRRITAVARGETPPTSLSATLTAATAPASGVAEAPARSTPAESSGHEQAIDHTPAPAAPDAPTGIEPHEAEPSRHAPARVVTEQIRIDADRLDGLINLAGEGSVFQSRLQQDVHGLLRQLNEARLTVERLRGQLRRLEIETEAQMLYRFTQETGQDAADFDPLEFDRFSTLQELSRGMAEAMNDVTGITDQITDQVKGTETLLLQQNRLNKALQDSLLAARLVRLEGLTSRFARIVRQTGHELGKLARLEVFGGDTQLDRNMLNQMVAAIEHILRNALAHGIEDPTERRANGKPETGVIRLEYSHQAGMVHVTLTDDGRGINLERVRQKAIDLGKITAEAKLSDSELLQLITEPGFSTAEKVTQISGRGVGMDVVASTVKQLGGDLVIESQQGVGTRFQITLPLRLAMSQTVVVNVGRESYAIPYYAITGVGRVSAGQLLTLARENRPELEFGGRRYAVNYLGNSLDHPRSLTELATAREITPVLFVHAGERQHALLVDGLTGSRQLFIKPLDRYLGQLRGLTGASVLPDGSVVFVIDLVDLLRAGMVRRLAEQAQEASLDKGVTVLVVDDSITIRKVTQRFLEREGFQVLTAKDGVDALSVLEVQRPDIMLLDIEMPRMDGFELAAHVRHHPLLKDVPIIMITSRTGAKHRTRAESIGVNGYLGKPYEEVELMATIADLVPRARQMAMERMEKAGAG